MYLRIVTTLAVLGALALLLTAYRMHSAARERAERRIPTVEDARLDARIGRVRLSGRFEDAVDALGKATGTNMAVRWGYMDEDDRDDPVHVDLRDVTFAQALDALLGQVRTTSALGFGVQEGVVTIGPLDGAGAIVRFYNVRDLVVRDWVPQRPEPAATQPVSGGGVFGPSEYDPFVQIEELATLLREEIDPDTWRDNGGVVGSIREIGGVLVISQTWENHRKVEEVLEALRRAMKADPASPPAMLRRRLRPEADWEPTTRSVGSPTAPPAPPFPPPAGGPARPGRG